MGAVYTQLSIEESGRSSTVQQFADNQFTIQ